MVLGPAVRALREAMGIRHGAFAEAVGISAGYLTKIETGSQQPRPDIAVALARRLRVPLDAITYPSEQSQSVGEER
jgi:transcriptional regulator with XRE-family HTH domain